MKIFNTVDKLINYGLYNKMINPLDVQFCLNRVLNVLSLEDYEGKFDGVDSSVKSEEPKEEISEILSEFLDYAIENKLIEDSITEKDIFDTEIMATITELPSVVNSKFNDLYKNSPLEATNYFYKLGLNSNYIRRDRIAKDKKWTVDTEYGVLDITINLSKPEKDPKAIAAALKSKAAAYPKCQLCVENEGYKGRLNHPARGNHRIIRIDIDGEEWGFQYSPYVYYNEHCIVFNTKHVPMKIDESAFRKLFSFVSSFPHYFVGSNADLPIVGGSILTHEHFQGGHYEFAMERAEIVTPLKFNGFDDVSAGIVKWPMSVIRISSENSESLVNLAAKILDAWRGYTDEDAFIFAETDGTPHNTITPIARMRDGKYELDLVLRNNITTDEHPLGVYHPHEEYHHIKKENIGLIEVMGLAVLPARLKSELEIVASKIINGEDLRADEVTEKHADWVDDIKNRYDDINKENVNQIIEKETGIVFKKVLECAGVYKDTEEGKKAFLRFVDYCNK